VLCTIYFVVSEPEPYEFFGAFDNFVLRIIYVEIHVDILDGSEVKNAAS
jgi:hypothetical protein